MVSMKYSLNLSNVCQTTLFRILVVLTFSMVLPPLDTCCVVLVLCTHFSGVTSAIAPYIDVQGNCALTLASRVIDFQIILSQSIGPRH